jgi:hypothetical protein
MNRETTIKLRPTFWETILIVAAGIPPALYGARWSSLLTAISAAIGFGVWRCVRILGHLLQLKQAERVADRR